jgi:hypothetical protein
MALINVNMKRVLSGGDDQSALDSFYGDESVTMPHQSQFYSSVLLLILGLLLAVVVGCGSKILCDRRRCDCLTGEAANVTASFEMATPEGRPWTKIDKPEGMPGYNPPVVV